MPKHSWAKLRGLGGKSECTFKRDAGQRDDDKPSEAVERGWSDVDYEITWGRSDSWSLPLAKFYPEYWACRRSCCQCPLGACADCVRAA